MRRNRLWLFHLRGALARGAGLGMGYFSSWRLIQSSSELGAVESVSEPLDKMRVPSGLISNLEMSRPDSCAAVSARTTSAFLNENRTCAIRQAAPLILD